MFGVTVVRLYPRRLPDGTAPLGLSCDEEGVLLGGGMPLVFREQDAAGKATYRERRPPPCLGHFLYPLPKYRHSLTYPAVGSTRGNP
jgi:hypothetical protein